MSKYTWTPPTTPCQTVVETSPPALAVTGGSLSGPVAIGGMLLGLGMVLIGALFVFPPPSHRYTDLGQFRQHLPERNQEAIPATLAERNCGSNSGDACGAESGSTGPAEVRWRRP